LKNKRWELKILFGYLYIKSLAGYGDSDFDVEKDSILAEKALDTLLTDLSSVEGLIIDLRFNEGGEDEVSLAVARHFIANTKHAYSKQARLGESRTPLKDVFLEPTDKQKYLGPVVILTSSTTASAAEVLTLSLLDLSNVTVIGERSEGKLSNTLDSRVSSDIAFGLSNEFYLSSAGEWFEHSGIPVEESFPFSTLEERNQSRDFGIERAMEILRQ